MIDSSNEKFRVMVVEDNPTNARFLARGLHEHFKITLAVNGKEALELVRSAETRPHLILLDIMLPDISGHQVISQIKQEPATAEIPVIIISALDAEGEDARCLALGAADFITKPFSLATITARIRTHIELSQYRARDRAAALRQSP